MIQNQKKLREIITILGKQGSGKSHTAEKILIPNLPKPVLVLDPLGEYRSGIIFESASGMLNHIKERKPNQTGIYTLSVKSDSEAMKFIRLVRYLKNECTVIFEEASMFCNPHNIPDEIDWLVRYGRHHCINLVFIARRSTELHRNVTAQSNAVISFQQSEPRDVQQLKSIFSEASSLPDLYFNPMEPEKNEYMVLGRSNYIKMDESQESNS